MKRFVAALLLVLSLCGVSNAADYLTDYSVAYRYAQATGRLLLVSVGCDYPIEHRSQHVACRLPAGWKDARHESLKDLGGSGIFIVDLTNQEHYGQVVNILPASYCTPEHVTALYRLPRGSLTQRTLIWAVRVHPERPQSTDCEPGAELMSHAERHSKAQADRNRQYHNLPVSIANSEIVAESWEWNKSVVDAAIDLVHSWRQSPGHWRECSGRHARFGYGMCFNGTKWFGCGVFKD